VNRKPATWLVLTVALAACSGSSAPPTASAPPVGSAASTASPSSPPSTPAASTAGKALFQVDGRNVYFECTGTKAPTVILEAGRDGDHRTWDATVAALEGLGRVCWYDRAGIGRSQGRAGASELSVGDRADHLHALLDVAGEAGPYVLVGFSYGGMIVRAFTDRYPEEVAGLVFVDATHEDAWAPDNWFGKEFPPAGKDGAHAVDVDGTREELLHAADLGDRPTVVLTQGTMNGEFERQWTPIQDKLAALSTNSLHMVATESDHFVPEKQPSLVAASILAVVVATGGTPLPACGPSFERLGAECLDGTMGNLLAAWDARRAAVVPRAGKLPAGTYGFEEDGVTFRIALEAGHLDVVMEQPDGALERLTADYAATGDEVTFVWPIEHKISRTSGVNVARWTADPDGTLHFVQLDAEQIESWIAAPWVPVADEGTE
jgi:alpha/beta superfamily hydrolase